MGPQGQGSNSPHQRDEQFMRRARRIAQGFTAEEEGGGVSRTPLELRHEALLVYEDPERGVQKAAMFGFFHGRNPEAVIVVELYDDRTSVELARLAAARVVVAGHGKNWQSEEGVGGSGSSYWAFSLPKEAGAD